MKQKLLLFIVSMLLPMIASADAVQIQGLYYELNLTYGEATLVSDPYFNTKYAGDVIIPDQVCEPGTSNTYYVKYIGVSAFEDCTDLRSVTFNTSQMFFFNEKAFKGCTSLTSITIPNTVTSIGTDAFYECKGLTSVTIGDHVLTIQDGAFEWCEALTSIDIPNSVTSIGRSAFSYCRGLTSVTLGNSVQTIGKSAFSCCDVLTSITIPNSVTSIGENAFYYDYDLATVTLGNSVESIGGAAFQSCSSLASITIPSSVTSVGPWAFADCGSLASVTIGSGLTDIGWYAFCGCRSLTSITVNPDNPVFDSRDNCNAIIETATNKVRSGCKNTVIPSSVTAIEDLAFFRSYGMTSFTIPDNVTSIGSAAFCQSYDLTSVAIGSGVTAIGSQAFKECRGLKEVYCYATDVPETEDDAFEWSFVEDNATLYVPKASMGAYAVMTPWSNFKAIEELGKIKLSKSKANLEKGKTLTLTATVSLPDKSVTWKSSNSKVAKVSSTGKVTGVKAGTATITCTSKVTGKKATCKVTVGYVSLDKTETVLEKGKTLTLTAKVYPSALEDKTVTWKSSNTKVAKVSADGVVTGVKSGTATITCTSNATSLKTTCTVTVGEVKLDKTEAILEKYSTLKLTPTVYPSALTDKSVTWKSSNTKIAMVANDGTIMAVKAGTATITCTSVATGLKATCKVTIGYVKLDKTEAAIEKGSTMTLKATVYPSALEDKTVTWKSSNTAVATVTSKGKVTGVKAGTATITCTSNATGLSTTCTVTVGYVEIDKTEVSVSKGKTVTLTATVYPTKLEDKSVTWKSSNTAVATVTSAGKVKGVKAGVAAITCTSNATGLSTICVVTVTETASTRSLGGDGDDETTGIKDNVVAVEPFDVYDLSGRKVRHQVTSLDGLPKGIYIVNGKKVFKKD